MLRTMVLRSLVNNARISAWSLATLTTCAALVTLFVTTTFEVGRTMSHTLRRLGANAVAYPAAAGNGATDWARFDEITRAQRVTAVRLTAHVGMVDGRAVAVVSADPPSLERLTPYWAVTGRRALAAGECLVGRHVAAAFHLKPGEPLTVAWPGEESSLHLAIVGTMETGDEDDDRVFVGETPAPGPGFSYALVAVAGGEGDIARLGQALTAAGAGVDLKPLRQVLHGEQHVLGKIRLLFLAALMAVLVLTALGVSASMLARVVERRKEFALLQAIGARRRAVVRFLLAESATVGVSGAIVGFVVGTLLAVLVVWRIFHVMITPHWLAFVTALATTVLVSLLAGGIACGRTLRFRTAAALRGE